MILHLAAAVSSLLDLHTLSAERSFDLVKRGLIGIMPALLQSIERLDTDFRAAGQFRLRQARSPPRQHEASRQKLAAILDRRHVAASVWRGQSRKLALGRTS